MPDASQNSLFSLLAARYGLNTALSLMSLFGDSSPVQKGFGAASALGSGANLLGNLTGNTSLSSLGGKLGTGLGLAGTGYGIYQTATNPNLSTGQKAGHSGVLAGEAAGSLAVPYFGVGVAAKSIIDLLRRSGSPQLAATGRALGAPALPVEGLLSVLQGDQSPRAAFNSMIQSVGQIPLVGGPMASGLRFFGLGTKPTTGTMFRKELGNVFNRIPALKGTDITKYQAPDPKNPLNYSMYDPKAVTAGKELGQLLSAFTADAKKSPDAYALQAENILLNKYGNTLPQILSQVLPMLQQPAGATAQKKVA